MNEVFVNIDHFDAIHAVENSEEFFEASKKGNLIPLYRCIFSDHLTPVLAYRCLVKEDDRDAPSFLFESVEPGLGGSSIVSTYSSVVLCKCYAST
jgi:anthranilate synthase component 1